EPVRVSQTWPYDRARLSQQGRRWRRSRRRRAWRSRRAQVHQTVTALSEPAARASEARVSRLRWWKEALIILAFYGVDSVSRDVAGSTKVASEEVHAFHNAKKIVDAERFFHIFVEHGVQRAFSHMGSLTSPFLQFWNTYYGTAHFVVTVV